MQHLDLYCLFLEGKNMDKIKKNKASRQAYLAVIQADQCSALNFIHRSGSVPKVSKHTLDEPPLHSQLASICRQSVPAVPRLGDPPAPSS